MRAPLIIVGDGWQNPTGLARIARDLHAILEPFAPIYVGYHPPAILVQGGERMKSFSHLGEDWGASSVIEWIAANTNPYAPGVLLVVWNPDRASHYLQLARKYLPGWAVWGYFAVDGHDVRGMIGEPAASAVRGCDRVLAYTQYGAGVLGQVRRSLVPHLPHGHAIGAVPYYDPTVLANFHPRWAASSGWMLGCVATNQPRKDLHLFFAVMAGLRAAGENAYGWLHTDELVRSWDIGQLMEIHAMQRYVRVTTGQLTDQDVWQCYGACSATICVGRGEGFGYPIIESLACGTPCLAMDYAGGAELTPWDDRYPWNGVDYTNFQGIGRPLGHVPSIVERLQQISRMTVEERRELAAYCTGSVAHLNWERLKGYWQEWVQEGMDGL